jgi:RNA polymerase sigma factor (sigma-70 family)
MPPPDSERRPVPALSPSKWFAEEVQPHESTLRSWLRGLFPSLPDVDDVVQESYVRLIRAREAGKVHQAKAYLFATARNAALDFFRRRKIVSIEAVGHLHDSTVLDDRPGVADALSRQQELDLLAEAVRGLPDRCRQTITLRLLYGLSHKEIATELRVSEHTVKAQLAKGMRRCAVFFEERGLLDADRAGRGETREDSET